MSRPLTRRNFLAGTAAAAGLVAAGHMPVRAAKPVFKTTLRKAQIMGSVTDKACEKFRQAGFEGIETTKWSVTPEQAAAGKKTAEKFGLTIHSVMRAWTNFNKPDRAAKDIASVETALKAAAGYGAGDILLVPCRTSVKGPQPWEFDYEFDAKTGRVTKVVKGDNAKWADYIKAQNEATDATRAAMEKLIPAAERAGVVIGIENVWNNLWCKADLFTAFIDLFDSKWVRAYFDIANHVKYGKPEKWIATLNNRIVRCHVKEFKLAENGHGGKFVGLRTGSVNWPAVRKQLDAVGYNGWMTVEGNPVTRDISRKLDLIIAGK